MMLACCHETKSCQLDEIYILTSPRILRDPKKLTLSRFLHFQQHRFINVSMNTMSDVAPPSNTHTEAVDAILNFYPTNLTNQIVYHSTPSFYTRKYDPHTVQVTNIRDRESEFSLSKNGIEWFTAPTSLSPVDFSSPQKIQDVYLPEGQCVLKEKLGCDRIILRQPNVRKDSWPTQDELSKFGKDDSKTRFHRVAPARDIHIDCTPKSAEETLNLYLSPSEISKLKRWVYFSYWRPIKPILKDPLCAADITTINAKDLVVFERHVPKIGRSLENYSLLFGEGQRFYFKRGMQPEDVMLVRFWDSEAEGEVKGSPHSSFEDEEFRDEAARESIEVRCFALWE